MRNVDDGERSCAERARARRRCRRTSASATRGAAPGTRRPAACGEPDGGSRPARSARSATSAQIQSIGSAKKARAHRRATATPLCTGPPARRQARRSGKSSDESAEAPERRSSRPLLSASDNSRRSTNDNRTRSVAATPRSSATPASGLPVCGEIDDEPEEPATRPAAPNSTRDAQRRGGWLASAKSASAGSANTAVSLVPSARARASAARGTRRGMYPCEVGAGDQQRGDDEIVQCSRGLQRHHGEGRERERAEHSGSKAQTEPARDPDDRYAREEEREELNDRDVTVSPAQDHRGHRLDLGVRREGVDALVGRIGDVGHGVLLLPQRGPREVVEERVPGALRNGESARQEVRVRKHREGRHASRRHDRRARLEGRPPGLRRARTRPTEAKPDDERRAPSRAPKTTRSMPRSSQRPVERASESADDLRRREEVDREEERDGRAKSQTAREQGRRGDDRPGAEHEHERCHAGQRSREPGLPLCGGRGERHQLAPELLDLVAELGGVLEAKLLGREIHLLLERDEELLELVRRHPLDVGLAAPAP